MATSHWQPPYLDVSLPEEFLDEVPVAAQHPRVVDPDAAVEQLRQLLVPRLAHRSLRSPELGRFLGLEECHIALKGIKLIRKRVQVVSHFI